MRTKGNFRAQLVILLIFLPSLFCLSYIFNSQALALSIEEERILGEKFLVQVGKQFQLVEDDFADQFLNDLGRYLITPLETKPFPFRFFVVKDNTMNGFAAPGGNIFIFSGLIEITDSIDELAAIICHEIGHVSARHLAQRLEQSKKIGLATLAGILAGVLIGGPAAGALITGSMAAGIQTQLHYSREDERQADQLGFSYMKYAGLDPKGMITALKKIERGSWFGSDKVPAYLMTHPTGPERMSNLDVLLSDYTPASSKEEANRFRALFPFFKTVVRAKGLDSREAERVFSLQLKGDPGSSLPYFGLGIVYKGRAEYALAIQHLESALEKGPGGIPVLTNLGQAYQENGQDRKAISVLEGALKLAGDSRPTLLILGISYENLEEYEKAIQLFERLASFTPVKNEVYYHLGFCYGKSNRLALAHYNFGLYFKSEGQKEKAQFHFRKADDLSGNNSALKEKIRRARGGSP